MWGSASIGQSRLFMLIAIHQMAVCVDNVSILHDH